MSTPVLCELIVYDAVYINVTVSKTPVLRGLLMYDIVYINVGV